MSSGDDAIIRFKCGRCLGEVRAAPSEVGGKKRCPACQAMVTVPTESRKESGDRQPYVSVTCSACGAVLEAPAKDVGRKGACPDCKAEITIPPPNAVVMNEEKPKKESPAPRRKTASGFAPVGKVQHIRVYCRVCNTMMYGAQDQVGEKLTCPDCYTATEVPPPADEGGRFSAGNLQSDPDAEYRLQGEPYMEVCCPDCETLLEISKDQMGMNLECPDCGGVFYVER